ncbi:hypothetical protein D5086_032153 [Populus alba]|uniref:Uncharacterized protein n=1 Tax=Populus alba TaxID=43335 RepID=A0ACC4AKK9_POPAL
MNLLLSRAFFRQRRNRCAPVSSILLYSSSARARDEMARPNTAKDSVTTRSMALISTPIKISASKRSGPANHEAEKCSQNEARRYQVHLYEEDQKDDTLLPKRALRPGKKLKVKSKATKGLREKKREEGVEFAPPVEFAFSSYWLRLHEINRSEWINCFSSWAHHCRASNSQLIYSNSSDRMATKRRPHKLRSSPGPISYFLPGRTDLGPHPWLTETHILVCFTAV